jgi:hypothetical protein
VAASSGFWGNKWLIRLNNFFWERRDLNVGLACQRTLTNTLTGLIRLSNFFLERKDLNVGLACQWTLTNTLTGQIDRWRLNLPFGQSSGLW